jgi:hypothetical protein
MRPALLCALAGAAVLGLGGCASRPAPLYQWGDYQRQVYEYLKGDGTTPVEQLSALQAHHDRVRASGGRLPPGFRAQLALLNLRLGQPDAARALMDEEKLAFPESVPYMDFVLKSMGSGKS